MATKNKPSVVIDTNLFISAVIKGGNPFELLRKWQSDQYILTITQNLFEEIAEVFTRDYIHQKYQVNQTEIQQLLGAIKLNAKFVDTPDIKDLPVHSRDMKDDKVLAAALGGKVDYLISGDEDLLILNGDPNLGSIKILKVKEFLDQL